LKGIPEGNGRAASAYGMSMGSVFAVGRNGNIQASDAPSFAILLTVAISQSFVRRFRLDGLQSVFRPPGTLLVRFSLKVQTRRFPTVLDGAERQVDYPHRSMSCGAAFKYVAEVWPRRAASDIQCAPSRYVLDESVAAAVC
jgi:hypothetical protein